MKGLEYGIRTVIDHSYIFDPLTERKLARDLMSIEDLILQQRIVDEDDWYLDEFGLYVYAKSSFSKESVFIDKRYEP